jgi:transposase
MFLPPYSPDFNPIEMAFSKIKALLKKAAARTVHDLWDAIRNAIDAVSPKDAEASSLPVDMNRYDTNPL